MLSTSFRPSNDPTERKPFATSRSTQSSTMSSGSTSKLTRFLERTNELSGVRGISARMRRTRSHGSSFRKRTQTSNWIVPARSTRW